jgi:hypothetical protein
VIVVLGILVAWVTKREPKKKPKRLK